jgi:asparagine synthase (glutamine-hydrolysing)
MNMPQHPFFYARKRGDEIQTRGTTDCVLGHELFGDRQSRGPFAQWTWDGRRLEVSNDRYGFYPIYYWTGDNEIGLSPSIPTLLSEGAPVALDEVGLAVFLRLGFFIEEHTPFKAIRALPPGARLQWRDGRLQVLGQFAVPKATRLSRSEAIERYTVLFKAAIQRRLPQHGQCAVPLSGGRDSRHILLELCAAGFPPQACVTYRDLPPRPSWDAIAAAQLCEALGLPHVVIDQPTSRFQLEMRKNVKTNFCADEHEQYLVLADYITGKYKTLYDGIAGDVLSSGLFLDETRLALFEEGRFTELVDNLFHAFPVSGGIDHETLLAKLLPHDQYRRFNRDAAVESLSTELRRHAAAPNPVGSFFFYNRTRREMALAPLCISGEVAQVLCPYLDHDLYDFLASLPAELFLDRSFHTDTIRQAYPRYAHVPFDNEVRTPQVESAGHYRQFGRELTRYALTHQPSRYVRYSYLLPKSLKCSVNAAYGDTLFSDSYFGPHAVYLLQLGTHC